MKRIPKAEYILAASVALMTLLVYLPALQNNFVTWDDNDYVYENPFIRSFNGAFFQRAFLESFSHNWHPLTWISHALDYALWGLNPMGHHLTSIVLHGLNTLLVVLLVIRLLEAVQGSGFRAEGSRFTIHDSPFTIQHSPFILVTAATTGLLFGLHPLHVESVAWVSERKDLLCALFYLLSIMAYMKSVRRMEHGAEGNKLPLRALLSALCLFILALMSKPMAVTLPVVLVLLDWYPFQRIRSFQTLRPALAEKLPFFALSLFSSIVTVLAQGSGAIPSAAHAPLSTRVVVAAQSVIAYLGKMIVPLNLVPFYPYPEKGPLVAFENLAPIVVVAGITVVSLLIAKKQKVWFAAWGYYCVTLVPVLGIVQVGQQSMADRYTYLPSLGPFLVAGLGAALFWEKARMLPGPLVKRIGLIAAAGIILWLSFATVTQTGVWKNGVALWSSVIEKYPRTRFAYNNRGMAYDAIGLPDKAIEDFGTAIALDPRESDAYSNLGMLLGKTGQFDKAIENLEKALALNPPRLAAYNMLNTLGVVFAEAGQVEKAFEQFNKAIGMDHDHAMAYNNRGLLYAITGDKAAAASDYQKACGLGDGNGCNALRELTRGGANLP